MFTGRRYDDETWLYYYRARYYNPNIGRFLQPDPIGYAAGLNLYTYVGNNPLNWIDPYGFGAFGAGIGGATGYYIGKWLGGIVGGAIGTWVSPGAGTAVGARIGAIGGAILGTGAGAWIGDAIENAITGEDGEGGKPNDPTPEPPNLPKNYSCY